MNGKMKKGLSLILSVMLLVVTVFATGVKPAYAADTSKVTIDIVSMNDFHGALKETAKKDSNGNVYAMEGAAWMAGKYDAIKNNNPDGTILISAGDMFQGSPISNALYGKPIVNMMNTMGTSLMAIGNHEFDWGIGKLNEIKSEAKFPLLSCNIYNKNTGKLADFAQPYVIVEKKGVKIAFIGVTTPEATSTVMPTYIKDYEFKDPAAEVNKAVDEVLQKDANAVVVVGHIGSHQDENGKITGEAADLANKLDSTKVNAIISAHTHQKIAGTVNNIAIVQGYYNGRALGHITLVYDNNTQKVDLVTPVVEDSFKSYVSITKNPDVQKIVEDAENEVGPVFDEVIGTAADTLKNDPNNENVVGEWITDVMTKAAGAQFGFETAGDIRADIEKGNITVGDIYTVLPWDNFVYTMKLTGAQIKNLLENGANLKMGMVQVSGLKFKYDLDKPEGSRVFDITDSSGTPLDMNKKYVVAVNDYLAAGGDNYTDFTKGTDVFNTGKIERDMIFDELKLMRANGIALSMTDDNRVVRAKQPKATNTPDTGTKVKPPKNETATYYIVVKGDCLWSIAKKQLGNGTRYMEIYMLNKNILKNPNSIYIGQKLALPA